MRRFEARLWRGGVLIATRVGRNQVTAEGVTHLIDVAYKRGGSPSQDFWNFGVFSSGSITVASTAAVPLVTEFTDYVDDQDDADRVGMTGNHGFEDSVDGVIGIGEETNLGQPGSDTPGFLNINGAGSLRGAFLINSNVQGGLTGVLYAGADFDSPLSVGDGDTLSITYETSAEASDSFGAP